jgi:hypothetical protein
VSLLSYAAMYRMQGDLRGTAASYLATSSKLGRVALTAIVLTLLAGHPLCTTSRETLMLFCKHRVMVNVGRYCANGNGAVADLQHSPEYW